LPKSKDGLHQFKYDRYAYQIIEDITLVYNNVKIVGASNENEADVIGISNNDSIEVIKVGEGEGGDLNTKGAYS
jgi:hypothetical protein